MTESISRPVVSVTMATFNRAELVGGAIASVLAQDFGDFELIVVDDGSRDHTGQVVAEFNDPRLRYFRQENAGLAAARNTGIMHARGDYVTFLDDDDLYLPHCLAAHLALMRQRPSCGWTAGGYRLVDMQGHVLGESRPWESYEPDLETWLFWCPTAPSAVMVKREWLVHVGGFDPGLQIKTDWDMWLRLAHAGCPMAWLEEIVMSYRVHGSNMVRDSQTMRGEAGILRVLDKFHEQPGVVQGFRQALLGPYLEQAPPWNPLHFWLSVVVALLVLLSGAYFFRATERTFADIV
jgi:glycosyltransferase involved in cell wall biosynthesis